MKLISAVLGTLFLGAGCLPLAAQATGEKKVLYYAPDQLKAASAKADPKAPHPGSNGAAGVLGDWKDNDGKFQVTVRRKDRAKPPEVHNDHYHVFYVVEGRATFVTGGKVVGKTLVGGQTWKLDKGSAVVVPPGVEHWFQDIPADSPWIAFGLEVCSLGAKPCVDAGTPAGSR